MGDAATAEFNGSVVAGPEEEVREIVQEHLP